MVCVTVHKKGPSGFSLCLIDMTTGIFCKCYLNVCFCFLSCRPPLPESSLEKMKRFKRQISQRLRGSHTIDESLSELAEQMTIEENGLKDSGMFYEQFVTVNYDYAKLMQIK